MEGAPRFSSHQEELTYLHERVAQMERELRARGEDPQVEQLIQHEVKAHQGEVVGSGKISLEVSPDNNDEVVAEFAQLMQSQGITRALGAIEQLSNPHLADDVHRFLVQYIKGGYVPQGLKEGTRLHRELRYTLLQVLFPKAQQDDGEVVQTAHADVGQFLQSLSAIYESSRKAGINIVIELASPLGVESVVSYIAVPDEHVDLISQQLRAAFEGVKLVETPNDYNIFVEGGATHMSLASLRSAPILPLQTKSEDTIDALRSMYISLSEVGPERGAALQFVVRPGDESFTSYGNRVVQEINKGANRVEALKTARTYTGMIAKDIASSIFSRPKKDEEGKEKQPSTDTELLGLVNEKLESSTYQVLLRVVASSGSSNDANALLSQLQGSFSHFTRGSGNQVIFSPGRNMERDFSYRTFNASEAMSLSVNELSVMVPLGSRQDTDLPELEQTKSTEVPAPINLPTEGLWIGDNVFRGESRKIFLSHQDRLRHLYAIGQTGTGKSTFLKHMVVQDIQAGNGVCFIDPHGSDVLDILALIPPERYSDVIYFDPAYRDRVFGLNLLEYDPEFPEQKTFVVNELLNIFRKLYGQTPEAMGPAFEQYFRNATLLVMEDPESGSTLIDIARVLSDESFRALKLSRSKNEVVNQFWNKIATQAGGEASLENIVPYITNKFDDFTANDLMRPIIGQQRSSLRFREIMDDKKILLVNLAKGRLGERNANLLGLVLVGKIFMAALSRVDAKETPPPFYLYIDEFQNITTDSIAQILSEARKYGLGMTLAHQFIAQISDDIRDAVFGNVGSMVTFRVGAEDAEAFKPIFGDVFTSNDLMDIENYKAHARMLGNGVPQPPFTIQTPSLGQGKEDQIDDLRMLSYLTYAKSRDRVEELIRQKMGV